MHRRTNEGRSRRGGLKFFILGAVTGAAVAGLLREGRRTETSESPVDEKTNFADPAEKQFPMGVDPLSPNAPV